MFKLRCISILLFFVTCSRSADKINVEVLFETLCPDSLNFIKDQLYPAWNELEPYLDIKWIPFGKSASIDGGHQFTCQHGTKECLGNRLLSCAINALPEQNLQVAFVHCFMPIFIYTKGGAVDSGDLCAQKLDVNFENIQRCYESDEGTNLQLQAEEDTAKYKPHFIPTIVFNGVFDQHVQDTSLIDFKGTACLFIKQVYPEAC